jgi:hypothetical protein
MLGFYGLSHVDVFIKPKLAGPACAALEHVLINSNKCSNAARAEDPENEKVSLARAALEHVLINSNGAVEEKNTTKAFPLGKPPKSTGNLDVQQHPDGTLTITDDGYFCRRPSPAKAIEFELKPYLVKKFGKIRIKQLIVKRPGQRNFMAAKAFCALFSVAGVSLPPIKKKLTKGGEMALAELMYLLKEKEIECRAFPLTPLRKKSL